MNDINKFSDDNIGGIMLFKFVSTEAVQAIPQAINHIIASAITLKPGYNWHEFYGTPGTIELSEDQVDSEAGAFYKKTLKAVTPKIRPEIDVVFEDMKNRKFILDVIDNNGVRKIIGSVESGLKFISKANTKSEANQRNEYSIEFVGEGENKSYTYNI